MCNQETKQLIVEKLAQCEGGKVVSQCASYRELQRKLGIPGPRGQFKRALGSAVRDKLVVWHRPDPEGNYETRPIVLRQPNPSDKRCKCFAS